MIGVALAVYLVVAAAHLLVYVKFIGNCPRESLGATAYYSRLSLLSLMWPIFVVMMPCLLLVFELRRTGRIP
jgi:hypothetical protein